MGDAEGFEGVLEGGGAAEVVDEPGAALMGGQEVGKDAMEVEPRAPHELKVARGSGGGKAAVGSIRVGMRRGSGGFESL